MRHCPRFASLLLLSFGLLVLPPMAPAAADTVAGKWHFILDTPGGLREMDAVFEQSGETVTGTWDRKTPVKGTFAKGELNLSFPIESEEGGKGTLKILGRLEGDTLFGSWAFEDYNGTYKATRQKQ